MSKTNFNQNQKEDPEDPEDPEGQEGQEGPEGPEGPEDPGYVIVDRVSDPPPSDAVVTAPTSLWSAITRTKAAFMDEIASRSTRASQFLQGRVATQENFDAACGAIGLGATVMNTAASHCGSALSFLASAIKRNFLPINQDFDTSSYVVNIKGIRFVRIGQKKLWVCADKKALCGYGFPVENLRCIEMFHLTPAICLFLLYTTTGCVFASVYTTQYGRDITCLNRITQLGKDHNFDLFETSDACMHGTVGLTVFYKDRSQRFFRVERDGAIHQILLICDSHKSK
jgi:hypothetical protein